MPPDADRSDKLHFAIAPPYFLDRFDRTDNNRMKGIRYRRKPGQE
jgi:hypothetical protein